MPILFNTIISNLKGAHCPTVRKYMSNNKSWEAGETRKVMATIQRDPDRLKKWADKTSMKLKSKCKILHPREKKKNLMQQNKWEAWLDRNGLCRKPSRDLVDKPNLSRYYILVVMKTNCILTESIAISSREAILPLCSAFVRLHMEYCVQFWLPSAGQTLIYQIKSKERPPKAAAGAQDIRKWKEAEGTVFSL